MEMEFEIENDEAGGKIKIKKIINSAGKIEDMKVWINGQLVQDGPKDPDYSDVPRHLVDPTGKENKLLFAYAEGGRWVYINGRWYYIR